MWAINNYDPTTLEIIIKKGGDVNATNEHGDTPLHEAVRQDSWTMVDVLLNNGANIFAKNAEGQTPRKLAKKLKHKSLKKYLKKQEKSRK
jgi:ankyrin repeat protein